MLRKTIFIASLIVLSFSFAFSEEKVKWINVHVSESAEETDVKIHLPFTLVTAAVQAVKTKDFDQGKVKLHLEDTDIDIVTLLQEIKKAPDGEYVKVEDKEANVLITKKSGTIYIDVNEKTGEKAKVKVTVPDTILDAVQIDEDNQIDVAAMLSALEDVESGDLVTVDAEGTSVRIWIE
jgi:hypothetical protein